MSWRISELIWNGKSLYYRWLRHFFVYTWIYRAETKPFHFWLRDAFVEQARYLDLAAGNGDSLVLYPRSASVVAVDFSMRMLQRLKNRFPIPILLARAEQLPFQPAAFNGVTAIGLMEYISQPDLLLADVHRILAPEGWFAVTFSQPNAINLLRNLTGNRIHFYTLQHFSQLASQQGFQLVDWHKTLFQTQVFLRKIG